MWLDTFVMGIILMLFGLWFFRTRLTERPIFRALAVTPSPVPAAYLAHTADQQYWLTLTTFAGSVWFVTQVLETFGHGFGQWINIGSVKCTSSATDISGRAVILTCRHQVVRSHLTQHEAADGGR